MYDGFTAITLDYFVHGSNNNIKSFSFLIAVILRRNLNFFVHENLYPINIDT